MDRRLYKSRDNRMITGVCGGLAEYINADPTVVRAIFAIVSILSTGFPGIVIYIILAIIMPEKY